MMCTSIPCPGFRPKASSTWLFFVFRALYFSHVEKVANLKIAIVGCGKIADAHVEEIRKIPSVQLGSVCDLEPIMAEQLATRYAVPRWYCDIAQMLETEKPEVLHITTPPQSHLSLTRQAVAAGCHVFIEKPVAPRLCDAEAIVAAAAAAKRKLAVNYWPNFEMP